MSPCFEYDKVVFCLPLVHSVPFEDLNVNKKWQYFQLGSVNQFLTWVEQIHQEDILDICMYIIIRFLCQPVDMMKI